MPAHDFAGTRTLAGAPRWLPRLRPDACFWAIGLLIFGAAAVNFAGGHNLEQTSRDIWQHLAALRALIADPFDPANPFVTTEEGSRHFHPYWVAVALFARAFGMNEWQALAGAGFFTASVMLAGVWSFGRAFYRNAWGPLALLLAMMFGWSLPISHTGYHSPETLIEGFGYPATLLVALSLLLWALVIRSLRDPRVAFLILPLSALMFATHQLGAGIGFMAAGCFVLLWPEGDLKARAMTATAMTGGLLLAMAWPYHDPLTAITRTGNASWSGGLPFYSPLFLIVAGVPSLAGLWGLYHRRFRREALPVLAAFGLFAAVFAMGPLGYPIATRFVMPAVLMLHVGLGAGLILIAEKWTLLPKRWQLTLFAVIATCIQLRLITSYANLQAEELMFTKLGSAYDAALTLTDDIPDGEPVGVYDVAVWPVVATGQRVASVPWPEPGIVDLPERQAAVERMFDPSLSREQRLALARRWGVSHLIMDRRGPLRRHMPPALVETLQAQSVRRRDAAMFIRFDLE